MSYKYDLIHYRTPGRTFFSLNKIRQRLYEYWHCIATSALNPGLLLYSLLCFTVGMSSSIDLYWSWWLVSLFTSALLGWVPVAGYFVLVGFWRPWEAILCISDYLWDTFMLTLVMIPWKKGPLNQPHKSCHAAGSFSLRSIPLDDSFDRHS